MKYFEKQLKEKEMAWCPICKSFGFVFKFYCSNDKCQNYVQNVKEDEDWYLISQPNSFRKEFIDKYFNDGICDESRNEDYTESNL